MGKTKVMMILLACGYAYTRAAGSMPKNPSATLSPVSESVILLTLSERFDTTGCHDVNRYALRSTDDVNFQIATRPARIGQHSYVRSLSAAGEPDIAFELFLIFSKPMKNTRSYRLQMESIAGADGKIISLDSTFTFSDAELRGNVKANQVGYLPHSPKLGKLGRFLGDAWFMPIDPISPPAFQVIGANQQVAFSGTCQYLKTDSAFSGESVFQMDFTALQTPGLYYLYVPGYGRSEVFTIADDCYNELYFNTARALYYQRAGKIDPVHGGTWSRDGLPAETAVIHASHTASPLHSVSDYPPGTSLPMKGGWLDAGDYGRYVPTAASALFILFTAYELYPDKFPDNHLNIPESGNGIPDWLDEAKYETDWLMQMQAPDGGVYFRVTPATWSQGLPGDETHPLFISEKTTQATALFAAAMAMASRNFKKVHPGYAASCLEKARQAWAFLNNHLSPTPPVNVPGISAGPYPDPIDADNRAWAAAELYKTTGEASFHAGFVEWYGQIPHQFHATMSWQQHTFKAAWAYATTSFEVNQIFVNEFISKLNSEVLVNYYNRTMNIHAYHGAYHQFKGYVGYGTFGMSQSYAFDYILFASLLQKPELLEYAKIQLDIPLGNNPLSQSFITGAGKHSPQNPLHWSTVPGQFAKPVPGVPVFGPAASLLMNRPSSFAIQDSLNRYPYGFRKEDPYPVLRRYTDAQQAVEMSEFTVQEISVTAAVFAFFSSIVSPPLPVRLQSFEADATGCKVRLQWETSEETNVGYFSVRRSRDGKIFEEIGRVDAAGTTGKLTTYCFEDTGPEAVNYYRLTMIDNDLRSENSVIKFVSLPCKTIKWSVVPAGTRVFRIAIENRSESSARYRAVLYNQSGMEIREVQTDHPFDASQLSAGLYIIHLHASTGEDLGSKKLLIP